MPRTRQQIYLEILSVGLISIRGAAFNGDAEQCHAEADHLHNLPGLLNNLDREELHNHYWNVMRPGYLSISKPEYVARYDSLWKELREASERETQGHMSKGDAP